MNLNDILNNTIAGLIVALICACFGFLSKTIKEKLSENSELFWLYTRFSISIVGVIASFSSVTSTNTEYPLGIRLLILIFNVGFIFMVFDDAIYYVKNNTNNSDKKK